MGSWEYDLGADEIVWTDEVYCIFGYEPQEFATTYQGFLGTVHPEDRDKVDKAYSRSVREGNENYEGEHRVVNQRSGEIRYVVEKCVHIRDETGEVSKSIGMVQDITEQKLAEEKLKVIQKELQQQLEVADQSRMALLSLVEDQKQAEEQIRRLNTELENRVRDRTAQLETANQELEAFAYSVSHDLRAPLRALDGFSEILMEEYRDRFDTQGTHYLTRIRDASQRMGRLIEDLLNLSRVTRREMNRTEVDLSKIARLVAGELSEQYPDRKVSFDIAPEMRVNADPNLMHIVLENLLSNAFRFTANRENAVIKMDVENINGERVYTVRDNGAGFDMAYADKPFIPFQRLHSAQEFPGAGIGLVSVQRIIWI